MKRASLPILITGSEGLVGAALRSALIAHGDAILGFDLRGKIGVDYGDVRDPEALLHAAQNCRGIVHLAAVSRVVWGEQDPTLCWSTNVAGTRSVVDAALHSSSRPWLLYASSREVYGQATELPVAEDAPLLPLNVYGRSKVAGEKLMIDARASGLRTAIVRLSNVYGSVHDHADRVVPCFVRAAVCGDPVRIEGRDHAFDFTHVDDVVAGLQALIDVLEDELALPPIHLLTGVATTLGMLADACGELSAKRLEHFHAPPRSFDVSRFVGDPSRAAALLGWRSKIELREGLERLARDFRGTRS